MATRAIYLISARNTSFQRAHFSIFVPLATNPDRGTKIHAVGTPMAGYVLEFKRNYNPSLDPHDQTFPIGQVDSSDIVDSPDAAPSIDSTPRGKIELAATQIPTPGINHNFMAPVNDVSDITYTLWRLCVRFGLSSHTRISRPPTSGVKNGLWNMFVIWLPKA